MVIYIEGSIGSGKSTLLKELKNRLQRDDIYFLEEPVDDWNTIKDEEGVPILVNFYKDFTKFAFPFQMMAYISRLSSLKKRITENPNCIIISERSLYTDRYVFAKMLFDTKKMNLIEYTIYLKWFDEFLELVEDKNKKIVYLKTDSEVCLSRIKERSRDGESSISLDYLVTCNDYHNYMIDELRKQSYDILTIDANRNADLEVFNEWCNLINEFITHSSN